MDITPQQITCTDCGQPIKPTYPCGNAHVTECENETCRLYKVTLAPAGLAALTEQQRAGWGAMNARQAAARAERQRDHDERMARYPEHLRRALG